MTFIQPRLDAVCFCLVLVQASDAIAKMDGVAADNEHCGGLVFLLEVALYEVAVEDFYSQWISKIDMRQLGSAL